MYEYLDRSPQVGDVVEFINNSGYNHNKLGSLHYVTQVRDDGRLTSFIPQLKGITTPYPNRFKVVKTKPGNTAQVGDTIIRIANGAYPIGTIHQVYMDFGEGLDKNSVYYTDSASMPHTDVLVLCKAQPKEQPMTIQQLLQTLFGAEKPTTDYDKRPAIMVVAYNRDGSQMGQAIADNIEQVKAKVADTPELWGCKVLTYTLDQEVSVDVPVKATKAKVAKLTKE